MLTRYYPVWEYNPSFNVDDSTWKNTSVIWYASAIAHDSYTQISMILLQLFVRKVKAG